MMHINPLNPPQTHFAYGDTEAQRVLYQSHLSVTEPEIKPRLFGSKALGATGLGVFREWDLRNEEEFIRHMGGRAQGAGMGL